MFKKRYLLIFIVLLLVIGTIVSSERENYRIIFMCRDAMSSSLFIDATDLKYSYMDGPTVFLATERIWLFAMSDVMVQNGRCRAKVFWGYRRILR